MPSFARTRTPSGFLMPFKFVCSAVETRQFPREGLPEIAFVGRSNVGKSSLMNTLLLNGKSKAGEASTERNQLARVSRTPGRTQHINFYCIDQAFYFVDLPGYGFAQVPKREMIRWRQLAESYLIHREMLRLVVVIVDSRRGARSLDRQMTEWLKATRRPFLVAASKTDKLGSSERKKNLRALERDYFPVLPFSARTREGVTPLWSSVRAALAN